MNLSLDRAELLGIFLEKNHSEGRKRQEENKFIGKNSL
jgi:hypothetical protein